MRTVDLAIHIAGLKLSIKKEQRAALGILDHEITKVHFALNDFNPVTGVMRWRVGVGVVGTKIHSFTNSAAELTVDREMRVTLRSEGSMQFVIPSEETEMQPFPVEIDWEGFFTVKLPDTWYKKQTDCLGDF